MGLDMYLQAKLYGSDYTNGEVAKDMAALAQKLGLPTGGAFLHFEMSAQCAYWRKANAIHAWFVTNCAEGEDDCKPVHVSREQLTELRDLCAKLLASRSKTEAEELLPPQSGFFFGSPDIDEYYWQDIQNTVEQLTPLLTAPEQVYYEYRASW